MLSVIKLSVIMSNKHLQRLVSFAISYHTHHVTNTPAYFTKADIAAKKGFVKMSEEEISLKKISTTHFRETEATEKKLRTDKN
jgi:hypothetical protein